MGGYFSRRTEKPFIERRLASGLSGFEFCGNIVLVLQCFAIFFQICQVFSVIHRSELLILMECTFLTDDTEEQGNT